MALTGLDIYKKLPRENCKECGVPTCLAFAMKVAAGQAGLDQCPRLSEQARADLGEASAPPQRLVKIGPDSALIEVGQETVLYRHEDKFYHPTAIALKLSAGASLGELLNACASFKGLRFTRVGREIRPDMIALVDENPAADSLGAALEIITNQIDVPLVLVSPRLEALRAAATGPLAGKRPVLYCSNEVAVDDLARLAQETGAPLCVAGEAPAVAEATEALNKRGVKDILISPGRVPAAKALEFLTVTRRAALQKKFRPLGYPALAIACGEDPVESALNACAYVCKYAAVLITDAWAPELLVPILTTRQNIFTDPQKPVQVEPKLYEIGEVTPQSPLLVTTNFSLSYYSVESEVESARVPCRILAVNTDGTSVLTAWAADKFTPDTISKAMRDCGAEDKFNHRQVVIPGHVAVIAAQLAEQTGWKVLVGPKEASGIGPFLKNEWKSLAA